MGCRGSKLDDLEAVALCRDRSRLLAEAIACRYALADAHAVYSRSMKSVGEALHRFLDAIQKMPAGPSGPRLQLPAQRKGENPGPVREISGEAGHSHSHSDSGSHIHFHSDDSDDLVSDDDSGGEDEFPLHSEGDSPILHHLHDESSPPGPAVSYAKNTPPNPSVSHEQRAMSPEAVHFGGGDASSSAYPYYGYPYSPQSPNFYPSPYVYPPNYGGYAEMGGYFGGSSPPASMPRSSMGMGPGSPSPKEVPPPPSPPKVSTWDFLNPFENYESYFAPYTPSRSSKDVREEEGIPDLEDEENVVVKEAYGDEKVASSASSSPDSSKGDMIREVEEEPPQLKNSPVDAGLSEENAGVSVDKNVLAEEAKEPEEPKNAAAFPLKRYHDLSDVVQEMRSQFDKASDSAVELAKMLEVGKQPYHQRNSVYKVSSRMVCGASPLSSSKDEFLVFEDVKSMSSGNMSSTLQKLYIWEKKLYDEVRAEEKIRVMHDRKCREMKRLDERGAEAQKLDSTLATVRKLSTKIRIAIQVVDSISNKISKLRDDELWPQISELIKGLMGMWNVMLECHRTQCQALSEANNLDSFVSGGRISDAHVEVTKQLELELLEWVASFSSWIHAQKSYVKALNGWLLIGLRYVPEETPDGIAPFSPGRLGAPPVFVICNQWAQTMERISENEVINAMRALASNVLQLWEKHIVEQRQVLMANKDMDRTLRIMEREEQEMRRAVETQNKKLVLVSGQDSPTLSEHTDASSLQGSLRQIFEAMENFSAGTLKAYEELHIRAEEERLASENEKVT